jgi:glycosyltransferase involved in cell wall biosynthesis
MNTLVVHGAVATPGGAEMVLEYFLGNNPDAVIYLNFFQSSALSRMPYLAKAVNEKRVRTSIYQRIPERLRTKLYKLLFLVHPFSMMTMKAENYEKVIISSIYEARHIRLINCKNISIYSHSPPKFLYQNLGLQTEVDHSKLSLFYKVISFASFPLLRLLDKRSMSKLHSLDAKLFTNSIYMQKVHSKIYKIDSKIVYPISDLSRFEDITRNVQDYYLCFGRIARHKRVDIAVEACLIHKRKLIIIGAFATREDKVNIENIMRQYPQSKDLITILPALSYDKITRYICGARALLFCGVEDFGIVPVEMIAAGMPVIALNKGGTLDTVQERTNGLFFEDETSNSLISAIKQFEGAEWDIQTIKNSLENIKNNSLELIK